MLTNRTNQMAKSQVCRLQQHTTEDQKTREREIIMSSSVAQTEIIPVNCGKLSTLSSEEHTTRLEVIDKLKINNLDEYKGELIAEEFARYFSSIGKEYAIKMPQSKTGLNHFLDKIPPCKTYNLPATCH